MKHPHEKQTRMPSHTPNPNHPTLAHSAVDLLSRADRHPILLLAFLLADALLIALHLSLKIPLWHDEIFTYAIAQLPTVHDVMLGTRAIDLNPPLSYLLTRASFHLFGVGTLQCRLPEIAGMLLALTCIFLFVRRRAGNSFGFLAAALLLAGQAADATLQARPYGLLLGFTVLALLAWQSSSAQSTDTHTWPLNLLLLVAVSAALLSHVFGLFGWFALVAAECVQARHNRRLDPGRTLALLLPLGFTWFYRPLIQGHAASLFPPAFQPDLARIFSFYTSEITTGIVALSIVACAATLFKSGSRPNSSEPRNPRSVLTLSEWVVILVLITLPLALILRLRFQHASFFDRYGLMASIGFSVLLSVSFYLVNGDRPAFATFAALLVLLLSRHSVAALHSLLQGDILRHTEPPLHLSNLTALTDPSLPIVDASGLTFIEMNFREPLQLLARTFYLTGGPFAAQYAHATIFEGMQTEKALMHLPGNVDSYPDFVAHHSHFYVVGTLGYAEDWILPKLQADGATLIIRTSLTSDYKDHELYEVSMPIRGQLATTPTSSAAVSPR